MSQAGIISVAAMPGVPTTFVANSGSATPVANILNILGSGDTVTSGAGNTITIVSGGVGWTDEAVSFNASVNNGFFCTAALTATLPAGATQGQIVLIEVDTASAVVIRANAGQTIRLGASASSVAGSATSSKQGDSVYLVFRAATSTWNSISTEGTWALA